MSFVFLSSGFGEFEIGLLRETSRAQARLLLYHGKIMSLSCGVQRNLKFDVAKQFIVKLSNFQTFLKTFQFATFKKSEVVVFILAIFLHLLVAKTKSYNRAKV